ncbi:MAG: CalY family protein [Tepidanaerobacteraceae bacterium]|jgi:predicted ribosomally synthesized peptide with SipW-like signal peptide|nr:CalY family protein [Tepidanaerobacteraceae bacterium]
MRRNIIISLVLIGLLAFGIGFGTFAYFTSQATSQNNTFTAGTLTIDSPGQLTASLAVGNIYPGWTTSKTITVHNSGSLDFKYRISVQPLAGNMLYDGATPLQVSINGGAYTNINSLGYVELGNIAAGQDGTFTIAFKLPEAADNSYQGASGTFTFVFDATQTSNPGYSEAGQ